MGVLWIYSSLVSIILLKCNAHIPVSYYDWAEPNSPVSVGISQKLNRQTSLDRLTSLRNVMSERNVAAYIIPTADAHNSQYIAPCDARREWISGLSGSSGTAVVTPTRALMWTDGRYVTQFFIEVDTDHWELMRQGTDVTLQQWLTANMAPNSVVGVDPTTYTRNSWTSLQNALSQVNVTLSPITDNLVDLARINIGDPAPARPNESLLALEVEYTGRISSEKISDLLIEMRENGASALVLTALDDIAYTLNIRGTDIPYNPVFFSYLVIRADINSNNIILFWGDGTLSTDIVQHLNSEGVSLVTRPYEAIFQYLNDLSNELPIGSTIWLSQDGSEAIHLAAEADGRMTSLSTLSPVALMKCIKNDVELQGFRTAHIKDGIAVVRFLRWIHEQVDAGYNVTEMDASDKLEELRGEEEDFMGPSFATIAGAGENGAIIHYKPNRDPPERVIRADDMFLIDSGGQYKDGTTDITRTRHMSSNPTEMQRLAFTRVLKGQIMMGTAVIPERSTGNILDILARKALFDVGLNYDHGTGHGVGHFLNVHEGPSGIGTSLAANDPGITPGMIFSNEPGFYEVDGYGIRHEDLVEVIQMTNQADHILASGMVGDFSGRGAVAFYTISLAPHQTACLDVDIMNEFEIKYLNDYHSRVLATLGPILLERNLTEDYDWLVKECAPISKTTTGGVSSVFAAPLLIALSLFGLWIRI